MVEAITIEEWEDWCLGWFDKTLWVETYKNWEIETKEQEIKNLKKIIKNRRGNKK
ncbi:MAG TPA: hypothetical protein VMZ91_10155 [Candidatus Paceibacterota bacterium]|nr:hypothetical protein [Candidatus Paceibacterota bacterium]